MATLEEGKPAPLLEIFFCIFLCLSIKKKNHYSQTLLVRCVPQEAAIYLNTGLLHLSPDPFCPRKTSIAPSGALLTSAPGTFTFTEIHPPTFGATPGFYLGRLHSTHDVSNSRVPFPDPCSSRQTSSLTISSIPGSCVHIPFPLSL